MSPEESRRCQHCYKREGEVVQDEVITVGGETFRHVFRLCRWCRGVWTKRGCPQKVIAEPGDDDQREAG